MIAFKKYLSFIILLFASICIKSQTVSVDDPIAAMLDSLQTQKMFETAFSKPVFPKNNKFKYSIDSIPKFDEYTYQARLAKIRCSFAIRLSL